MSTKKRYQVTAQIEVDGETIPAGKQVDLTDEQAAYLVEKGHVEPAPTDPAPKGSKTLQSV